MTPRELQTLDYIRLRLENGVQPTFREIANSLNLSGPSYAFRLVEGLIERGHLYRAPGRHRSLTLPGMPDLKAATSDALRAELARRGELIETRERHLPAYGRAASCAADTCGAAVRRGHLFCRPHWFALPHPLRDDILRAHAARDTRRYQTLVAEARDVADACGGVL